MTSRELHALVNRYFEVLNGAEPELLREILADDFRDEDPLAASAGVEGVIARFRLYRAVLPDARSVVENVVPSDDGTALVSRKTRATGLDGSTEPACYRYRAQMTLGGGRIRSHHVISVAPARWE